MNEEFALSFVTADILRGPEHSRPMVAVDVDIEPVALKKCRVHVHAGAAIHSGTVRLQVKVPATSADEEWIGVSAPDAATGY